MIIRKKELQSWQLLSSYMIAILLLSDISYISYGLDICKQDYGVWTHNGCFCLDRDC
jgi:hypothetical protein